MLTSSARYLAISPKHYRRRLSLTGGTPYQYTHGSLVTTLAVSIFKGQKDTLYGR